MKGQIAKTLARWLETGRRIGFFLLLVAGSAAIGFLIAWPLWLFATSSREAYTIVALCVAAAGIVLVTVRATVRSRKARRDIGGPRRTALSVILGILLAAVVVAGAYVEAVLFYRGLWILAIPAAILWAAVLWLLGFARRALRPRKDRPIPAEHNSE